MTELDLIKTLSLNLDLASEYNINQGLFYSDFASGIFEKMLEYKAKGYNSFKFNNHQESRLKDTKYLDVKNLEGIIGDIADRNLQSRIKDFTEKSNEYVKSKDFDSKEIISAFKDRISDLENMASNEEEVITTNDFDEIYEELLQDDYTTMSEAITEEFPIFDEMTGGWVEDTTSMLAGSSGRGKSAISINLALNTALSKHFQDNDLHVLYFNYEMSPKRMFMRCIMKLAHVTKEELRDKKPDTKEKLARGYTLFKKANMLITHDTPKTLNDTKFMIRKECAKRKVRLVFIDYIGRIVKDSTERQKQEHQLLRDWVIELSNLRRDIADKHRKGGKAIPFSLFILSQLNREAETEGEANARKHMQGSYSMISELDYLYSIDYMKEYGFVLKNDKARSEEDGFWINFMFEKEYQNFKEVGLMDRDNLKKENKDIKELDF